MAFRYVGSAWRTHLETGFPPTDRFFIDFRQQFYPPLTTHSYEWEKIISTDNQAGSHNGLIFRYTSNLVDDPEDLTTVNWTKTNTTVELSDLYVREHRLSKVTSTVAGGYVTQAITFTGDGPKGIQVIIKKSTAETDTRFSLFDSDVPLLRFDIRINWSTQVITYLYGAKHFEYWLDSETVVILGIAGGVVAANTNVIFCFPSAGSTGVAYFTAIQTEDLSYPTPYTPTSRAGIAPDYVLPMPASDKFTIRLIVKPWFLYLTTTSHRFFEWYADGTHQFRIYYRPGSDQIAVYWQDGAAGRYLYSQQFDDGTSYDDINQWIIIDAAIDLTTGDTTGSQLWINRVSKDTTWSGAIDARSSNFPILSMGHEADGSRADSTFNHALLIPDYVATDADVQNDYKDVLHEQIFWYFNGCGLGQTRCNVTSFVTNCSHTEEVEKPETASLSANTLSLDLISQNGEFADDQYAVFDAPNSVYNGTVNQKYMQKRCPIFAENWHNNAFEPWFVGRLTEDVFKRRTQVGDVSRVSISAEDFASEIARDIKRKAKSWEDKKLADWTEANSLVHLITREASEREIFNFASNSSFENATIGNSWLVAGTGATFSRIAGGLFGDYQGDLVYGSAACEVAQTIIFTGTKKLNVGETWTFYLWLLSTSACGDNIILEERDAGGLHNSSTFAWALSGGESWKLFAVTHTITDSTSDRLRIVVELDDNVTLSLDGAMLVQAARAYNWFVLNDNDGTAGVESADDADSDSYDQIGFDVDAVDITHPWAILTEGQTPWSALQQIADGTVSYHMGIDKAGILKYRTPFALGYEDPASLLTIISPQNLVTQLDVMQANKIIIHGVKIIKRDYIQEIWNALKTGDFETAGLFLQVQINNTDQWPPPATYPNGYWAKFADITVTGGETITRVVPRWGPFGKKTVTRTTPLVREVVNESNRELIDAQNLSLHHSCFESLFPPGARDDLTHTIFDTTTRLTEARILFTNSTGTTRYLIGCWIRGKLVLRYSGDEGWQNDDHIDYDSIYRNGIIEFRVGNNFIVTQNQVDQLADYYWKDNKTKKHIYQVTLPGTRFYLEPGEWYTHQVGGSGEAEYIDSTVRCMSIKTSRGANELGQTVITLREMEENWKFDSNVVARYIASGSVSGVLGGREITVASSTYNGPADIYCDGTNDHTELQNAIDYVAGLGGGIVRMTEGTYNTAATLSLYSNVILRGAGANTIIKKNVNDHGITIEGSSGDEIENVSIEDLIITRNASDTNAKLLIQVIYAKKITISHVIIDDSFTAGLQVGVGSENVSVIECESKNNAGYGIFVAATEGYVIQSCICHDNLNIGIVTSGERGVVINNIVYKNVLWGIYDEGDDNVISSNQVYDNGLWRLTDMLPGLYIYIIAIHTLVANNFCRDNGNLADRSRCEDTTSPMVFGETVPYLEPVGNEPTWARDATEKHDGSYSYKFTFNGSGPDEYVWLVDNNTTTDMHGLIPGLEYTFRIWIYVPSTGGIALAEIELRFDEYVAAAWSNNSSSNPTATDTWEELTVNLTLNAATTGVRFGIKVDSTASATEIAYGDDVWLQPIGKHNEHEQNYKDAGVGTQLG